MRPLLPSRIALPLLFVLLLLVGFVRAARAESEAPLEQRGQVLLVVAAEPREARKLGQVVTELLGRLSVRVRVNRVERLDFGEIARPAPPVPAYLARLFVDLREPRRAVLWFVDSRHDRILIRQLDRVAGSEELAREELGHILETSTEGLLSGAEIGRPRAEVMPMLEQPKPKESPPHPPIRESGERAWQIATLYEFEGFASPARVIQGPEASVYFRVSPRAPRLGIWVTGQYRVPMHVDASPVGARIEGGALRALMALDLPLQSPVKLRFALGGGTDLVELQPESSQTSGVSLAENRLLAFGVGRAAVGVELRVSPWLAFWARIAADLDPSGARYVFEKPGREQLVLRPWPVRPAFAIGLGFP